MKLSDAVNIGIVAIKFNPWTFYRSAQETGGQCTGCLLGAAWLAVNGREIRDHNTIVEQWPWLYQEFAVPRPIVPERSVNGDIAAALDIIGGLAFGIKAGTTTLEQAVDWIRENEPEEPKTATELDAEWKQELVEMST